MKTLTVERNRKSAYVIQTIYRDEQNKVILIDNNINKVLRKGIKTTFIRGIEYNLIWKSQ